MDVDLNQTPDDSVLPAGRYYVRCTKAELMHKQNSGHLDHGIECTWTVLAGERAGQTIRETRYTTWHGDPKNFMAIKCKAMMRDLGLLAPPGQRTSFAPEWFVEKTVWITVEPAQPYEKDGKTMPGRPQIAATNGFEQGPPPADVNPNVGIVAPVMGAAPAPVGASAGKVPF